MGQLRTVVQAISAVWLVCGVSVAAQGQIFSNPGKPETPDPAASNPATPGGEAPKNPGGKSITFPTGLYNEQADPVQQVREASVQARKENKRVIAMWGENQCGFCVYMNDLFTEDPRIKQVMEEDFVLVKIDIGKFDKVPSLQLAQYYGTDLQTAHAPSLTVIDPVTDKHTGVLAGNQTLAVPTTMTRVFDENKVFSFLMSNRPPSRAAVTVLTEAQSAARRNEKQILAYFSSPTCEPCRPIETWVRSQQVESVLSKAFVVVKLDTERMVGGLTLLRRLAGEPTAGPPLLLPLDTAGKPVSAAAKRIALPGPADESGIRQFVDGLLAASNGKLSAEDVAALMASLKR